MVHTITARQKFTTHNLYLLGSLAFDQEFLCFIHLKWNYVNISLYWISAQIGCFAFFLQAIILAFNCRFKDTFFVLHCKKIEIILNFFMNSEKFYNKHFFLNFSLGHEIPQKNTWPQ